jgi:succinate dehydrogenase/fumarate reductase cytochrome b subunit
VPSLDRAKRTAKDAARTAESSRAFEAMARAGYAANGVVHILIGVIVLVLAFGGRGESDQAGAFTAIADAPFGFVALWVLAIALWALGLWHFFEGFLVRPAAGAAGAAKREGSKWGRRIGEWGQTAVFVALGLIAASVALGARIDAEQSTEDASRGILSIPGGPFVLGLVGMGVGIGGISFIVMGFLRSFEKKMTIPEGGVGPGVKALGIVGFIAKGIALTIVGILLLIAAIRLDPGTAGGLDGAISALLALPYGPWLAGAVGVGLISYGVFCFFRARFADL